MVSTDASQRDASLPSSRQFRWRRFLQYRLQTLLALTALCAAGLAGWSYYVAHFVRPQQLAVQAICKSGAIVQYDFQTRRNDRPPNWPAWVVDLLGLDYFGNVTHVSWRQTSTTDADIEKLKCLSGLEELVLYETNVTDAGMAHLSNLNHLRKLVIAHTQVGDSGVEHLTTLTNLEYLDLTATLVTDASLEHLRHFKQLNTLHLEGTKVTEAGVAKLVQSLPNDCEVHSPASGSRLFQPPEPRPR
ncbi:MAG: hypothetical protein K8T25_00325 [Planctomycetia bacterium]|nr:hypothetical protein [Planctomycetia bacterium]